MTDELVSRLCCTSVLQEGACAAVLLAPLRSWVTLGALGSFSDSSCRPLARFLQSGIISLEADGFNSDWSPVIHTPVYKVINSKAPQSLLGFCNINIITKLIITVLFIMSPSGT